MKKGLSAAFLLAASIGGLPEGRHAEAAASATVPVAAMAQSPIVGLRRLTEAQYRNVVADVFGPNIKVQGRFEPLIRPAHQLLATGARSAGISPTGMEQFDAIGRSVAAQVFGEDSRRVYVPCKPVSETAGDPACAKAVLHPIGRQLFRRNLTPVELDRYVGIAGSAAERTKSFYSGLELALSSMLISPNFLYVVESAEPDPARPGQFRLDAYSRASRLSFLLWNTSPDESLLRAAEQGVLQDDAKFAAIAQAMVASPRLEDGVRAFFADMLMFEMYDDLTKDPVVYPRFSPAVTAAMPEQILRTVVDLLVVRNADYREIFTTRRTFVNRALGPIYAAPVANIEGWTPIEFSPSDPRSGILTLPGFLALGEAQNGRSSPTIRGRAIRELLLCQPVPDPPGNVDFTAVQETNNAAMPTARQRLSVHSTNPVCAGCHKITDPIGLTLEQFDGIGAFRTRENNAVIDASASLDGGHMAGAAGLGKFLAGNEATTQCVSSRALEYATGRPNEGDSALLAEIEQGFAKDRYRLPALFLRIATAPGAYQFQPEFLGKPATLSLLQSPHSRQQAR